MTNEDLRKEYPDLFEGCWEISTGNGWLPMISLLARYLDSWNARDCIRNDCAPVRVCQVKEKFGSLRFYVDGGNDYTYGLISFAEGMSHIICEMCGNPGTTEGPGWYKTLCVPCRSSKDE